MQADLGAFIRAMAARPFVWGRDDCCLILADWWRANHGHDPAAHLRGTYATRDDCHALLQREGGVLRLVRALAAAVDAKRSGGLSAGDFGVVRHTDRHYGAIRTRGGRWAVKSESGVVAIGNPKVVVAWSV